MLHCQVHVGALMGRALEDVDGRQGPPVPRMAAEQFHSPEGGEDLIGTEAGTGGNGQITLEYSGRPGSADVPCNAVV